MANCGVRGAGRGRPRGAATLPRAETSNVHKHRFSPKGTGAASVGGRGAPGGAQRLRHQLSRDGAQPAPRGDARPEPGSRFPSRGAGATAAPVCPARARPLGHLIFPDLRPPAPRHSSDPPARSPWQPRRRAHAASDPGPAALTAFFMVAAILDWTTARRGGTSWGAPPPWGPSRAPLTKTPLKHSTISTLLPAGSLAVNS